MGQNATQKEMRLLTAAAVAAGIALGEESPHSILIRLMYLSHTIKYAAMHSQLLKAARPMLKKNLEWQGASERTQRSRRRDQIE